MTLHEKEIFAWLLTVPGIGQRSCWRWWTAHQTQGFSWAEWWDRVQLKKKGTGLSDEQLSQVQLQLQSQTPARYGSYLQKQQIQVVSPEDSLYPALLKEIFDPPLLLFMQGKPLSTLTLPVAVVGTRHITAYGQLVTKKIVSELVSYGASIISGGMYGVDMVAHQTALANSGETVVVLGFGFGRWYPQVQAEVGLQLLRDGATMVSEYPPLTPPTKGYFPQRNRLIAGMSRAVVVTEAGIKSGSHITAECALENGREVMAVPGPITSPYSLGTAALLNEGATLISSGLEVVSELGIEVESGSRATMYYNSSCSQPLAQKILEGLSARDLTLDELLEITDLPLKVLFSVITHLEMEGKVLRSGESWHIQ